MLDTAYHMFMFACISNNFYCSMFCVFFSTAQNMSKLLLLSLDSAEEVCRSTATILFQLVSYNTDYPFFSYTFVPCSWA